MACSGKLRRAIRKERKEHPWASGFVAKRIASDHLCKRKKNPYPWAKPLSREERRMEKAYDFPNPRFGIGIISVKRKKKKK